jgi:hypothetical protein
MTDEASRVPVKGGVLLKDSKNPQKPRPPVKGPSPRRPPIPKQIINPRGTKKK